MNIESAVWKEWLDQDVDGELSRLHRSLKALICTQKHTWAYVQQNIFIFFRAPSDPNPTCCADRFRFVTAVFAVMKVQGSRIQLTMWAVISSVEVAESCTWWLSLPTCCR